MQTGRKTQTWRVRSGSKRILSILSAVAVAATLGGHATQAMAQGCVAAHSPQPLPAGLDPGTLLGGVHSLSITVGFRTYSSFRHYVGTVYQAQRAAKHNEVENHINLYDLSIAYQLTPRWSLTADIPAMTASRHQQGSPAVNTYRSGGIGDVLVGAQMWIWRPPTESNGNIALTASLKLPTGINDAKGMKLLSNGQFQMQPFDESIQPGDGTWGFSLGANAFRETYFQTVGYFTGSWLFNPADTTGVAQFRSARGENVISATDQYLWRGGLSHGMPKVAGLALSFGGRMEGIPVRDAFGASNGFRRPGYVISIEPGLMYTRGRNMIDVSGPWAMERNRKTSVTDYANHSHGDAAFSDYTIIASYTRTF